VWPLEHDVWVRNAIAAKQRKIDLYRTNAGVQRVSLLIHTPPNHFRDLVRPLEPNVNALLRSGCVKAPHEFERIFFWSKETGFELFFPSTSTKPVRKISSGNTYATHSFALFTGITFKTTLPNEPPVTIDYGVIKPEVIIAPPLSSVLRGRKPRFSNPGLRVKVVATDTTAQIFHEPAE
jgi:hypothetical protein